MTITPSNQRILLVPGHWLGAWAWDAVRAELSTAFPKTVALTLPGLDADDPQRASRTLEEQIAAIFELIAQQGNEPFVLVAHSGANGPVTAVLDRHPELVSRVVWVDSGPLQSGNAFASELPADVAELPLPPFNVLSEQASLEGLSEEALSEFKLKAVPEPGPVLRSALELNDEARYQIPTTLICCSISSEQVMELARSGNPMFAELTKFGDLTAVDLPTGHWPMWSRPSELAQIIAAAAVQK